MRSGHPVWQWAAGGLLLASLSGLLAGAGTLVAAERDRALLVTAVNEVRATAARYVTDVVLEAVGEGATTPSELSDELYALIESVRSGGPLRVDAGAHGRVAVLPPLQDASVLRRFDQQRRLTDQLVIAGEAVRSSTPAADDWDAQVGVLRTRERELAVVVADTAAILSRQSADSLDRQLRLLVAVAVVVVAGGAYLVGSVRRGARLGEARRHEAMVRRASDWVLVLDDAGVITYSTPAGQSYAPAPDAVLVGTRLLDLVAADDRDRLARTIAELRRDDGGSSTLEVVVDPPDGRRRLGMLLTDMRDVAGVEGIVINARDVTERHELLDELQQLAYADALTGLANRSLFSEHLDHALRRSHRSALPLALLYLDLDDFKEVNDTFGHHIGDELLVEVADRLRTITRPGDVVARLGGDEFAVLLADGAGAGGAYSLAERVIARLADPVELSNGTTLTVSSSVGIRDWTVADGTAADMLRDADLAMYAAKSSGKGQARLFDKQMHDVVAGRHMLAQDLRGALEAGQLWLAVQPKVSATSGEIYGVEGLLRWDHPERGAIPPGEFIPIAEESGLIVELGRWVLEEGSRIGARLIREPGLEHLVVSVNVSARQLASATFVEDVQAAVDAAGIEPGRLTLEVTEGGLQDDPERVAAHLRALRGRGFGISIDDFGTGYSSLNRLRSLPIGELKIDRSFVVDAASDDPRGLAMLRTIVSLGRELGMDVIAEGVEDLAQLEVVVASGVDRVQGFHFERPIRVDELVERWSRQVTSA